MNNKEKVTIKDIARHTGLSKGTVDRVLHNREGVSKKSYAKIMKVIEELGYEPNIYASLLARNETKVVAVILPHSAHGEFWELVEPGLLKGIETAGKMGIEVRKIDYNQYDESAFIAACNTAMEMNPAGVVLPPMFKDATADLTARLRERAVPYVFIDTKPEDEQGHLAYFGMPPYKSGYLCASILTDGREPQEVKQIGAIRIQRDKLGLSDPTISRREGFIDYIKENYPACKLDFVFIDPNKPKEIDGILEKFFSENPDIRYVAMYNSRIHLIVPFLKRHHKCRVVGFDSLSANLEALRDGTVTALIAQRPDEQIIDAISALTDLLVFGKTPSVRDNFSHMNILTRYNI